MRDTVRVGVVGTSGWSDGVHLPALASHPRASIAAICGRTRAPAAALAAKYGIPQVFSDYRAMLAEGGLDALVVATPDDTHHAIVMDALDAGLHVLCEKPLACSAAEARAMYQRAEAAGVNHMTFFTWRWMPYLRHMRALVEQGEVGRTYQCSMRYIGDYGRDGQYGWRFDQTRANGLLGDLGSHLIDLAHWLVGDITRVSAHLAVNVQRLGADGSALSTPANDAATLLVEFAGGAHGVLEVSSVGLLGERFMEQRVTLSGAAGGLDALVYFGGAGELFGVRSDGSAPAGLVIPAELWGDMAPSRPLVEAGALFCQLPIGPRLFIDDILAGRRSTPSFYDGWRAQEVVDAALRSHRTGSWVDVQQ